MPAPSVVVTCACCDQDGLHNGRRLRLACYLRHHAAGTLDNYPPLHTSLGRLDREAEYADLRAMGLSLEQAAERMGVTKRSAERYSAAIKARQAEQVNA